MAEAAPPAAEWHIETAFLDRDGTINRKAPEGDYVKSWDEFEFLPGAEAAIAALSRAGIRAVVVTNQRGVALGRMTLADVEDIHARMLRAIRAGGGEIDAIYVCPHGEGECSCRKPETGLFLRARSELESVRFDRSIVIGDSWRDMEAAARLGVRRAFVGAGPADADLLAGSLAACVSTLLG
jgi:histidinol-phosphate phosphatase family protein